MSGNLYSITIMTANAMDSGRDVCYVNVSKDQVELAKDLVERLNRCARSVDGSSAIQYILMTKEQGHSKKSGLKSAQ